MEPNGYNIQLDGFIPYGFEDADGSDFRDAVSYYQYDLEGAKKLMEAARFNENNRLSFEYFYSEGGSHEDIAVLLKEMWSQIYVDLELTSVEQGVYYDYVDNGEFTVCRYSNNDSTDPLNYFSIFTSTSQIEGCQSVNDLYMIRWLQKPTRSPILRNIWPNSMRSRIYFVGMRSNM